MEKETNPIEVLAEFQRQLLFYDKNPKTLRKSKLSGKIRVKPNGSLHLHFPNGIPRYLAKSVEEFEKAKKELA